MNFEICLENIYQVSVDKNFDKDSEGCQLFDEILDGFKSQMVEHLDLVFLAPELRRQVHLEFKTVLKMKRGIFNLSASVENCLIVNQKTLNK